MRSVYFLEEGTARLLATSALFERSCALCRLWRPSLAAGDALERMFASAGEGGEALYHYARLYIALGDASSGLAMLGRAIDGGFFAYPYFRSDPFLDAVRGQAPLEEAIARAASRHDAFRAAMKA